MKIAFLMNPGIRCIAGHSVKVFSDLEELVPDVRYITLLREPIKRYISHYFYYNTFPGVSLSFDEYLCDDFFLNFQTKSIVSTNFFIKSKRKVIRDPDALELAKEYLTKRFWLVGIVEEFDEFLVQLTKKLAPMRFDPVYTAKNISSEKRGGKEQRVERIIEKYHDQIVERNPLDLQLYQYVGHELLPTQRASFGPGLQKDLATFRSALQGRKSGLVREYIDYAVRRLYYEPITGVVRTLNGLPYTGNY